LYRRDAIAPRSPQKLARRLSLVKALFYAIAVSSESKRFMLKQAIKRFHIK
jgi:hypothetical protein